MAEIQLNGRVEGTTDVPQDQVPQNQVPQNVVAPAPGPPVQPPKGGVQDVRFDETDPNTRVFTADGVQRLFVLGQVGDVQVSVEGLTEDDFVITENEMRTKILAFNNAPQGGAEIRVTAVAIPPEELPQGGEPNQNPVEPQPLTVGGTQEGAPVQPPVAQPPQNLPPGQVPDDVTHG